MTDKEYAIAAYVRELPAQVLKQQCMLYDIDCYADRSTLEELLIKALVEEKPKEPPELDSESYII